MSTYSASKAVALPQSAEEGAAFAAPPLSLPASFLANGTAVLASLAWLGFGLSCRGGRILRTGHGRRPLAIAAFVVAGCLLASAFAAACSAASARG